MASQELQELNLTYLLLAQRLLTQDKEAAMLQLQLNEEIADLILSLPTLQLARLAKINQCLFSLRIRDAKQLEQLVCNERSRGMTQTHAALLLASASSM